METLISKWINETLTELNSAKANQNLYKMMEMKALLKALRQMRNNLLKKGEN